MFSQNVALYLDQIITVVFIQTIHYKKVDGQIIASQSSYKRHYRKPIILYSIRFSFRQKTLIEAETHSIYVSRLLNFFLIN